MKRGIFAPRIVFFIFLLLTVVSCGMRNGGQEGSGFTETTDGTDAPGHGFAAYDPPVDISCVLFMEENVNSNILDNLENETLTDNRWTRLYRDRLGINIRYKWLIRGDENSEEFRQKMNVALASENLPDIIPATPTQLRQLTELDLISDLTVAYGMDATPLTRKTLVREGTAALDVGTIRGKLMGIPNMGSSLDSAQYLWIRKDWLANLRLEPPGDMNDVLGLMKAFASGDPDRNGKTDTYGLAVTKELWGGAMGLEGFFSGYHAYPNIWIEDESGKLAYGSIRPEMKTAVLKLAEAYAAGCLDREFAMKNSALVAADLISGRTGMEFGEQSDAFWPLQSNRSMQPVASWQAFPLVSADERRALVPLTFNTGVWFAVRKGFDHPEALVRMFNLYLETNWGESNDFERYYAPPEAEGVWKLSPVTPAPPRKNLDAYIAVRTAYETGRFSQLSGESQIILQRLTQYSLGYERGFALWGWERIFGRNGAYGIGRRYDEERLFLPDRFTGVPTPTMVVKKAVLDKMQNETITKIIMGYSPISEFDAFVNNWKRLGGDAMTREANEWYGERAGRHAMPAD